ncbi:MAG: hypothetical protein ACK583_01805 [Cyanobacteriota bacterium]
MEFLGEGNSKMIKTRWAFTLLGDDVNACTTTKPVGVDVTLLDKPCRIVIGSLKQADDNVGYPHRHCMIVRSHHGMTRGQAKRSVAEFLPNVNKEEYFKFVKNINLYVKYMFIELAGPLKTSVEKRLEEAIESLQTKRIAITGKTMKKAVVEMHGPQFYARNKPTVDVMLSQPELLFGCSIVVPFETNPTENYANVVKVFAIFNRVVIRAIRQNGYICTAIGCENLSALDMGNFVSALVALPFMRARWEGVDCLPSVYLYGVSGSGKSYLFQNAPFYKKVASDAQGVGRYRLDGAQRAYLLNDVTSAFFEDRTNLSTLRQMTLGGSSTVKTLGDTVDVRGWVVATSNETPDWLEDKPKKEEDNNNNWEKNCSAWKRRFVHIKMSDVLDLDPVVVNWSHGSATDAVMGMYVNFVEALPDSLKEKLKKYTDHIMIDMEDDWDNEMNAVLVRVNEVLKELFDKDAFDVMREAGKREQQDVEKHAKKQKMTVEKEEEEGEDYLLTMDDYCPNECYMNHKHMRIL